MLRPDHRLHIRCEVTEPDIILLYELCADLPLVGMMWIMDHSPGQRQYPDVEAYRTRVLKQRLGSPEELERHIARRVEQPRTFGAEDRVTLARRGQGMGFQW